MAQVVSNLVAQQILRIFGLAKFSLIDIPTFTKVRSGSGLKRFGPPPTTTFMKHAWLPGPAKKILQIAYLKDIIPFKIHVLKIHKN